MRRVNKVTEAGANQRRGVVNVADLMASEVITARPDESVGVLRERMQARGVHALPIVDRDQVPVGILTTSDLIADVHEDTPAAKVMTRDVAVIPAYTRIHEAARAMLKRKIHHLVVTHEKQVVGILSSFDILHLVGERRFRCTSDK